MAAVKSLSTRREQFGERAQNEEAGARVDAARAVNAIPFLRGRLVSVKLAAATALVVTHGLGVPAAFIVVRSNYDGLGGAPAIAESATSYQAKLDAKNQLSIVATTACIVDLWFYPRSSAVIPTGSSQSP